MWLRVKPEWDKRINETFKGKQRLQEQEPETEAYFSVSNEIDKAKARIRAKQKNHQANVIKAYFDRLVHDLNIWMSNKVMPPPYMLAIAGLTEWPDKRMLSKEAQDYFEKFKLEISNSVMQQVDVTKNVKQQSKSGRPHLPEDVWAWEQVNQYDRPKTEVYKEWREN